MIKKVKPTKEDARTVTYQEVEEMIYAEECGVADDDLRIRFAGARDGLDKARAEADGFLLEQQRMVDVNPGVLKSLLYQRACDLSENVRQAEGYLMKTRQMARFLMQIRTPLAS